MPSWCIVDPTVMPPRRTGERFTFGSLKSADQHQWVKDHPGHIDDWDSMGRTVLYAAASRKDLALVQWLIDTQGADVNRRTKKGDSAYYFAGNCPLIARSLLDRGANPALPTSFSTSNIRQYMRDYPGHVEDRDRNGYTALYIAAGGRPDRGDDLALVKWLIDTQGVDVHARTEQHGHTALHGAKSPVVIRALLERRADPTLVDGRGLTPLMDSVKFCQTPGTWTIACLLEDRRVRDSINATVTVDGPFRGFTALHLACTDVPVYGAHSQRPHLPILRVLLEAGADSRMLDGKGRTFMEVFRQSFSGTPYYPEKAAALAVLKKEAEESTREAYLIMLRRRVVAGQEVALSEEGEGGGNNQDRRRLAAFMVGDCPTGVFTNVMDMLLPTWAPLREGLRN